MRRVSRTTGRSRAVIAALALMAGAAGAGDDLDVQDQEMLEFLGSWEAEDEDWLAMSIEDLVVEDEKAQADEQEGAEAANDER